MCRGAAWLRASILQEEDSGEADHGGDKGTSDVQAVSGVGADCDGGCGGVSSELTIWDLYHVSDI